jgi:hypothetical protein
LRSLDLVPAVIRIAPPGALDASTLTTLPSRGDAPAGTRRLDRCRVVASGGTVLVAVDSPEGPELVFREAYTELVGDRRLAHVLTSSGKALVVTKDDNCGCGSRLRGWSPNGHLVRSQEDPTR